MLVWSTAELEKYRHHPLQLEQNLDLTAELKQRDSQIMDMSLVHVKGMISLDGPLIFSDLTVQTKLVYPSTRSLKPVDLTLDFTIHEAYTVDEKVLTPEQKDAQEIIIVLDDRKLDLKQAIADNILLSIPTQVLTPTEQQNGVMPAGSEWQVMSEEEYDKTVAGNKTATNEQFAKLKELFPDSKPD
ncbi:DUF177 domain-containing protein [Bombilactobacillus thymidiniphilus]|uniref:DUF177 domain-containing protein n=1 Tax=Bombilactobacillus thymidiniphilus TaxID=2923363 RepID=A0ABY4PCX8_9LACO|nr:YceD family protein [Bombilactobacillus thymidiniphilus]UQS83371.1 DUF177 domain-containing protein [Bombilactobacillus thymidiniphilus]